MQPLNEDALLDLPEKKIWAVADGRGTQTAGSLASQSLIRSLQALHRDQDGPFSEQILKDSLDAAYLRQLPHLSLRRHTVAALDVGQRQP